MSKSSKTIKLSSLTLPERHVLELRAQQLTYSEIALLEHTTRSAINNLLRVAMKKLGTKTRTQAIALWYSSTAHENEQFWQCVDDLHEIIDYELGSWLCL